LGLDRKDDYPPQHAFEHPLKMNFQGQEMKFVLEKQKYDEILTGFYKLCGYDEKTGIPTRETLERLDLKHVAKDLEERGMLPK
jgi:aldehyde:ferredoxin oxidoreductase